MRHLFVTLLFILITASGYSQSTYFDLELIPPYKDGNITKTLQAMHQFNSGEVALVSTIRKQFLISTYDTTFQLENDIEIPRERNEEYFGSTILGDVLRIFIVKKIDKESRDIYSLNYDLSSKEIEKKKLYTIKNKKGKSKSSFFVAYEREKKNNENFKVSPNGEYIAFVLSDINFRTNSYTTIVFTKELEEVYRNSYASQTEKFFRFDDFIITDKAEVISSGKLYKDGFRDRKKRKANYDYIINKITSEESVSKVIDLEDQFIQELRFAQKDETIRIFGFYSDKSSSNMKGCIAYSLDGTDIEDISFKKIPFPLSIYNDVYSKETAEDFKGKQKELKNYYLDYLLLDKKGNVFLLAEEFYITRGGGYGGVETDTPHYGNILVFKFDIEGDLTWGRHIFKKSMRPSYNAFEMDDTLHVFLNTGKNIKDKSNNRKEVKKSFFEKSSIYDIVFDDAGEIEYQPIRDNDGSKDLYDIHKARLYDNTLVMTNRYNGKRRFLILRKK